MIVKSYEIDEALQLTPVAPERIAEATQRGDARLWLDLVDFTLGELEGWLDELGVTGLSRRLCLEARDHPGFYPLKRELVLMVPVLADTGTSGKVDFLVLLCRENLLLTLHDEPLPELEDIEDSESWLSERSIAGLVSAAMVDASLVASRRTEKLRSAVLALERRMDREPDSVEADEILDMRAEVIELGSLVGDQRSLLAGAERHRQELLPAQGRAGVHELGVGESAGRRQVAPLVG